MLMLRLATEVDWESEKGCFQSLSREIARFYALHAEWIREDEEEEGAEEEVG